MSYGTRYKKQTLTTIVENLATASAEVAYTMVGENDVVEARSGVNHGHDNSKPKNFWKYSFSKDGKTVKIYMGNQRTPIRRYRWVGPRNNRRKEFYILYVDRHIYQTIPKMQFSYRNAKVSSAHEVAMLKPNTLSYQLTNVVRPLIDRNSFAAKKSPAVPYRVHNHGLLRGRLVSSDSASSISSRDPFQAINWTPGSDTMDKLRDEALRGLYERVASRFPDVGTMVGESKETLSMIRKLLNSGVSLITDLIKKDKKRLLGRLKAPLTASTSAWLTYVYGIKPLVSDLESLQNLPNQYGIRTYTKKAKLDVFHSPIYTENDGLSNWKSKLVSRAEVRVGVIMSADLAGTQKAAAMNLFNPIGVGYQLIPFSFMVDWIYDMGGFLNSQSALQFGFLYGWETRVYENNWYVEQWTGKYNSTKTYIIDVSQNPFVHEKKYFSCSRVVHSKTSFPMMPTPKVDLSNLNEIKGLNALSILVQKHKAFKNL